MHLSSLRLAALPSLLGAALLFGCARPLPKYEKPMARTSVQHVRTTAYTDTEADHLVHGCKTCLGTDLRYGAIHSAAADWSRWPAGTQFRIRDTGEICEVDDIGWALSGRNTIDLYKPSKSAMNNWGVRTVDIEILRWGDDQESRHLLSGRRKYRHVARMLTDLDKRIARGETNPEPAVATVPTAIPATVAVAAPHSAEASVAGSGEPVLRSFRGTVR
jgi:3D (Asp-Asp-Asp) domain-containing protein